MRQIVRPPSIQPPTLSDPTGLTGDKWNEPDVRGALYAMHGFACAYCEGQLKDGFRGDVDHFRPKAHYEWLTYAFNNYLIGCLPCNREHKKDKFPVKSERVMYANRDQLHLESRLLLDPTIDPTDLWVEYDVHGKGCKARPRSGIGADAEEKVNATIDHFFLNFRRTLIGDRFQAAHKTLEMLFAANDNPKVERTLKKAASRYQPHGTVVRTLVRAKRSNLMPTPDEELEFLIADFCFELSILLEMDPDSGPAHAKKAFKKSLKRLRDEIFWALAVLWHAPPAATQQKVEEWLGALATPVRTYRTKLN